MKTKCYGNGLILCCLLILAGCESATRSTEVQLTVNGCPKVTRCQLTNSESRNNGDLLNALDETEVA